MTLAKVHRLDPAPSVQLLEGATGLFGGEAKSEPVAPAVDLKVLHAKIGELILENDFLD